MHCLNLKLYKAPNLNSADRIVQKDPLTTMTRCDPTWFGEHCAANKQADVKNRN